MEELKSKVEKLTDNVEGLLKTYYRLTLVRATQKAAKIGSTFLNAWIVVILSFFTLLFGTFAIAWWLGDIMNSRPGGFLVMAGFFSFAGNNIGGSEKKSAVSFYQGSNH